MKNHIALQETHLLQNDTAFLNFVKRTLVVGAISRRGALLNGEIHKKLKRITLNVNKSLHSNRVI